ncbi:MAG: hypothetical protein KC503_27135, partial [Myxococcales bacterium]|nr:hypothetical protein [Myxococcales bacterium]
MQRPAALLCALALILASACGDTTSGTPDGASGIDGAGGGDAPALEGGGGGDGGGGADGGGGGDG